MSLAAFGCLVAGIRGNSPLFFFSAFVAGLLPWVMVQSVLVTAGLAALVMFADTTLRRSERLTWLLTAAIPLGRHRWRLLVLGTIRRVCPNRVPRPFRRDRVGNRQGLATDWETLSELARFNALASRLHPYAGRWRGVVSGHREKCSVRGPSFAMQRFSSSRCRWDSSRRPSSGRCHRRNTTSRQHLPPRCSRRLPHQGSGDGRARACFLGGFRACSRWFDSRRVPGGICRTSLQASEKQGRGRGTTTGSLL